jgi:hypothetical protein
MDALFQSHHVSSRNKTEELLEVAKDNSLQNALAQEELLHKASGQLRPTLEKCQ